MKCSLIKRLMVSSVPRGRKGGSKGSSHGRSTPAANKSLQGSWVEKVEDCPAAAGDGNCDAVSSADMGSSSLRFGTMTDNNEVQQVRCFKAGCKGDWMVFTMMKKYMNYTWMEFGVWRQHESMHNAESIQTRLCWLLSKWLDIEVLYNLYT